MTHRRYWIYFLLFLFNVICYLDRINMSVAGRSVAQEFTLSPVALGYLFSSFLWAYVIMMLPSGRLVDSLGAHRMAAIGATIWSIAQMLSGTATGFVTMLLTRLGLGAGEAPTFPVSYRAVRDWGLHGTRHRRRLHSGWNLAWPRTQCTPRGVAHHRDIMAHVLLCHRRRGPYLGRHMGRSCLHTRKDALDSRTRTPAHSH